MFRKLALLGALAVLLLPQTADAGSTRLCNPNVATIVGTPGPDVLKGTEETDWITGLRGADVISGLGGDDVLCGGRGKDTIYAHDKDGFQSCQGDGPEELTEVRAATSSGPVAKPRSSTPREATT